MSPVWKGGKQKRWSDADLARIAQEYRGGATYKQIGDAIDGMRREQARRLINRGEKALAKGVIPTKGTLSDLGAKTKPKPKPKAPKKGSQSEQIARLLEENARLRELLKKHLLEPVRMEGHTDEVICQVCETMVDANGYRHAPDCALASALKQN